jgi:hypothetical protein
VTDSFQATIWRVPPGGGAPQVWFQNATIDGPFGPNGVRVDKKSQPLPWANPANLAFNNKTQSLLVTNHASLTGLPDPSPLFAVFDVFVNDKAGKLFKNEDD